MGQSYNIKLKKGDVEIEVHGPDKDFVSNKFKESILVAFDKPEAVKEAVNQLPMQVAEQVTQENASVEVQQVAVEESPVVEAATVQETAEMALVEPVVEAPAQVAEPFAEVLEASQPVEVPVQEAVITEVVQAAAQPVVHETVQEVTVVAPVESAAVIEVAPVVENAVQEVVQAPQLGKASLASIAQVSEEALLKVYTFKKDGFKVHKEFTGTTALKQINITKLTLIASEYVNGVAQLSGKALGKYMKAISTGNLATNLKKDSGIVKDGNFYRLNDAGRQAVLELIKSLAQS